MEPLLSTLPARAAPNEPHNLLARLYREIGISAVAAALQVASVHKSDPHEGDADPEARSNAAMLPAATADKAA